MDKQCENCLIVNSSDKSLDEKLANSPLISNLKCKSITTFINSIDSLSGSFDCVYTIEQAFSDEHLKNIFNLLNSNSTLIIVKTNKVSNLTFLLKSNGFLVDKDEQDLLVARKPEYEVGSSQNIIKKVWSLAADDIADSDLIDDDELLDEKDKARPKDEDLKVCATTKQRKACANCSCGLKEELEKEEMEKIRANTQNVKSSCGNCYLGDAFRCESCPYRGLPAFKPGEKVVIDNLTDDL